MRPIRCGAGSSPTCAGFIDRGRASGAAPIAQAPPPLPTKPSIAVMPFANLSDDPEQEYFADGMVVEIVDGAVAHPLDLRHRQRLDA